MSKHRHPRKRRHYFRNSILIVIISLLSVIGAFGAVFYHTTKINIEKTYAPLNVTQKQTVTNEEIKKSHPLTFLVMGVDSRQEDLSGRTDTLMVVTINPNNKQTTMVSIPRDTFIESEDGSVTAFNKINASYVRGGVASSILAVKNLLNIDIDHYVTINFSGLTKLIDDIGGITVSSDMSFSIDGMNYYEGKNVLSGKEALGYTRMRYDDPRGTYGRDKRQQQVIEAVLDKVKSAKSIMVYQKILEALGGNVKTDLAWEQLKSIFLGYNGSFGNITHDSLHGEGQMINNYSFQIIPSSEKNRIHNILKQQSK